MGDSVTPEILSNMIRQYFSQERPEEEAIQALNHLRRVLHEVSPFAQEPVDCVLWVKADDVTNGAIVIHTQRLKSDPGGNLLS